MTSLRLTLRTLSVRRWLTNAVKSASGSNAGSTDGPNYGPPQVSKFGMIAITCWVGCCVAGLGGWQLYAELKQKHELETKALNGRIELIFSSVADDLKRLAQSSWTDCSLNSSQELARLSIRSEFARSFFVGLNSQEGLCGPFGPAEVFANQNSERSEESQPLVSSLVIKQNAKQSLFSVTGLQRLKPSILLQYTGVTGLHFWAEIPASRILADSRTTKAYTSNEQGLHWSLKDHLGATILRQGPRALTASSGLAHREIWAPEFGYRLSSAMTLAQLTSRLADRMLAWAVISAVLSLMLVKAINLHYAGRMSPERKMRNALRKRQIEPVIQPIVSMLTGECLGGEVLMRWKHPVRGLIPPAEFISLAEENGMITPMSEMLMRKARDQLAELKNSSMYFAFNITAAQLRDPLFPKKIQEIFDDTGLAPTSVVLELTEREAIGEHDGEILGRLRALGFRIAIDDFGTGQSSLSMLQGLQIDRIKIDREFVRTIDESTERRPVLDTIIVLAKELAVPVIAEGIETQAQWAYLAKRKVEAAQGYLIAKPMLIKDFTKWLDTRELSFVSEPEKFEGRLGATDRRYGPRPAEQVEMETSE